MKFALDAGDQDPLRISAYSAGCVTLGGIPYRHSLLVVPGEPVRAWPPRDVAEFSAAHFELLAACRPEIVLVGTGRRLRFPPAAVLEPLTSRRIGVEVMDTGAACRAYNFLLGEGRRIAAALLMIEG